MNMSVSDTESEEFGEELMDVKIPWNNSAVNTSDVSRTRYEATYNVFKHWCNLMNKHIDEKVLLEYFVQRSEKLKAPASLWAEYSMLKSTIFSHDSVDISTYATLTSYIKRKTSDCQPRESKVFTKENMHRFLIEAPDEKFLIHKVAMIFGIVGALKRQDLYNLTVDDIENHQSLIVVKIPNAKNNIQRTFIITNKEIPFLDIYRKYAELRPQNATSERFFLVFRNGKCNNQVVGKNTIGTWPSQIAKFLNLQEPQSYTGHVFRRSSAAISASKSVDVLGLIRHEDLKLPTVSEQHEEEKLLENVPKIKEENLQDEIEEEMETKPFSNEIPKNVSSSGPVVLNIADVSSATMSFSVNLGAENSVVLEKELKNNAPISISNCSNCTFIFNINNEAKK